MRDEIESARSGSYLRANAAMIETVDPVASARVTDSRWIFMLRTYGAAGLARNDLIPPGNFQ